MDFGGLSNLGWREALFVIIAFLTLYVVTVFLRIYHLKHKKMETNPSAPPLATQAAVAAYTAVQTPDLSSTESPETLSDVPFPWNEPPSETPDQLMIDNLEREVAQLRKEVGGLRAEVLVLREEQRREYAKAQATQNISPLYNDAMQMALQGHDANAISQHCGIARAEAELVVALVRNRND